MLELETARLFLRDFKPEDFDDFYATSQDPEYRKFYSERETTPEFWRVIFDRILRSADEEVRMIYQAAICTPSGEIIGTCGVRIEDRENQQASYGCAIARPYWGQGLAYEASKGILDYGFIKLSIHRVFAQTISENMRARWLAERLGMRKEGELRHNRFFRGRWWNTVLYSILRDEWENTAQPPRERDPSGWR